MTCQSCVDAVRTSLQGVAGKSQINFSADSPEASGRGRQISQTNPTPILQTQELRPRERKECSQSHAETQRQSLEDGSQVCPVRTLSWL